MSERDGPPDLGRISTLRVSPGSTPPGDAAQDWSGRVLAGRYELVREIGRGGMGIVYLARHVVLRRSVAVKVLRPEFARSEDALVRFEREARAAAALGSPHIVEVLDFGREASGEAWMVMELLEGEDLRARIRREGPLGEAFVRALLGDIGAALREAHAKGIVHRDLKSENVLLVARGGREVSKVVDFGISKVLEDPEQTAMTARDVLLGTPHYMAPEAADPAARLDHRVDLYSLGCIAYESLTGRLPFTGRSAVEVLYQHVHAPLPPPSSWVSVGARLDAILRTLLAKRPEDRFADADALLAALAVPERAPRVVGPSRPRGGAGGDLDPRVERRGADCPSRAAPTPARLAGPPRPAPPARPATSPSRELATTDAGSAPDVVAALGAARGPSTRARRPARGEPATADPPRDAGAGATARGVDELRPSLYAAGARASRDGGSGAPSRGPDRTPPSGARPRAP
ncbi:MAG: protein kinase [Polyangiales bacterium]